MSPIQQIHLLQLLRPALWLLAFATAAGCSGADLAAPGSTNIVAIAPSPGNGIRYVERVDFSLECVGSDDHETDDIRVEGSLSLTEDLRVAEVDAWGTDLELPPGPCSIQFRASDSDDEVICTSSEPFDVSTLAPTEITVVLVCSYSIPAPPGSGGSFQ